MRRVRLCVFLMLACHCVSAKTVINHDLPGQPSPGAKKPASVHYPAPPPAPLAFTGSVTAFTNPDNPGAITMTVSGGTPPYRLSWDGFKITTNSDYYSQLQSAGVYTMIDTTRLYTQLDSLRKLTARKFLTPGVYYARVYSTTPDSMNVAAVVTSPLSWALTSNIVSTATVTTSKTLNNWTYMPRSATQVRKTNSSSLTNNYALSSNLFGRTDYSFLQCEITDITSDIYFGLRTYNLYVTPTINDLSYFFRFNAKTATYYNGGTSAGTVGYDMGDVFSIKIDEGIIYYYKNDGLLGSYTLGSDPVYQLKVVMNQVNATLGGIGVVNGIRQFPGLPIATGGVGTTVTDVSCGSPCSGSIAASVFLAYVSGTTVTAQNFQLFSASDLVNPVATYAVSPSVFTTTINGLCAGDYVLKFNYNDGTAKSVISSVNVAYMPDWINQANVNVDPTLHNIGKSTGANWTAGANSANEQEYSTVTTDFFEFTPNMYGVLAGAGAMGFTFKTSANYASVAPADVQFGIYMVTNALSGVTPPNSAMGVQQTIGTFFAFDRQNNPVLPGISTYYANDRLRITRNGHTFRFYKNNGQVYSTFSISSNPNTDAMVADVSLYRTGNGLTTPRISFACPVAPVYALLKRQLDGHYYQLSKDQLYFKYDEEYDDMDAKLQVSIYNSLNQKVLDGQGLSASLMPAVSYGDNYYRLDLSNTAYTGGSALAAGYYVLEVTNEKQEKWYLRFKK